MKGGRANDTETAASGRRCRMTVRARFAVVRAGPEYFTISQVFNSL